MRDFGIIQTNNELSALLAIAMAEFELKNGAVQTSPIHKSSFLLPFMISCPEKPKAIEKPKEPQGPRKPRPKTIQQHEKVAQMPAMIAKGMTTREIAAACGWTSVHTRILLTRAGLSPKERRMRAEDKPGALEIIRAMSAAGASTIAMAIESGKNRKTVLKWIIEYNIFRAPKVKA